jgi:hypothetical protein
LFRLPQLALRVGLGPWETTRVASLAHSPSRPFLIIDFARASVTLTDYIQLERDGGVASALDAPAINVTRIASATAELAGKSVQLIRDMLPWGARRVIALANVNLYVRNRGRFTDTCG